MARLAIGSQKGRKEEKEKRGRGDIGVLLFPSAPFPLCSTLAGWSTPDNDVIL
jgi:hypothetical protein